MNNVKGLAIGAVAVTAIFLVMGLSLFQTQPPTLDENTASISDGSSSQESATGVSVVTPEGLAIQDSMKASVNSDNLTGFGCFQRMDGIVDVNENGWYAVVFYDEVESEFCEQDDTSSQFGAPVRLDINRAGPDYLEESEPSYTEYRLLNGTILAFGEKRINYSDKS